MRQASLKLKTSIENVNIMTNNVEVRKIILNTMFAILAALAFWYVLIIGNMTFNIVERRVLEKEALVLSNEIGNLELSYLSVSNSIDLALSHSMGFKETKATFATRKALGYGSTGKNLGNLKLDKNEI
ncbi:MAG: hypothetical protein WA060_02525 [Minisyncoccia bacterium]